MPATIQAANEILNADFQRAFFRDQIHEFGLIREGEDSDTEDRLIKLAGAWDGLARLEFACGCNESARQYCTTATKIWERLVLKQPASEEYLRKWASSQHNLGIVQQSDGRSAEAKTTYQQATGILEQLLIERPLASDVLHELAGSYINLGNANEHCGEDDIARRNYDKAIDVLERLVQQQPLVAEYWNELAGAFNNLGIHLARHSKLTDAGGSFASAMKIWEKLVHENQSHVEYQARLADCHLNCQRLSHLASRRRMRCLGVGLIAVSILAMLTWLFIVMAVGPTGPNHNAWAYHLGGWLILGAILSLIGGGIAYGVGKE